MARSKPFEKDCPSSKRCFKPNCGDLHHTSLQLSDSGNSRPNVKKTSRQTTSSDIHANCRKQPNTTNATPAIHLKSSLNNFRQPPLNTSQLKTTATVDPENNQFPKKLLPLLQVIPVSLFNGDKDFDTYALIDPGSTGTYELNSISRSLNLETGHQFDLDVQFMNLSRSFSVRTYFSQSFSVRSFLTTYLNAIG